MEPLLIVCSLLLITSFIYLSFSDIKGLATRTYMAIHVHLMSCPSLVILCDLCSEELIRLLTSDGMSRSHLSPLIISHAPSPLSPLLSSLFLLPPLPLPSLPSPLSHPLASLTFIDFILYILLLVFTYHLFRFPSNLFLPESPSTSLSS